MAYQVLARKWRPQRFDQVIGQRGVTQTLQNAIATGRLAQAFIFAGPRGVGKTTTARILSRALNCVQGPTPNPCGVCDACREIAQGRNIDVLEIDAATHTGIDNVRDVIIDGLAVSPVRDRYKIFIIDEVHRLSQPAFDALLKSIEEPPPHVVFMMATTDPARIPETIISRSQLFEFRTIGTKAIADQLRAIAAAENIDVEPAALALLARAGEGSLRDALSAFDQVIAFAGDRITAADVSAVLGLVGRDLLFDIVEAVAREDGPALFALADRAVEAGHDLRLVCRELSGLVRDLLVLSVDPARLGDDAGFAPEGEHERLQKLAARFSREDLMRAFDVLARAEVEIRAGTQPRYYLEMALLRWMHLRRLVPIEQVIDDLQKGTPIAGHGDAGGGSGSRRAAPGGTPGRQTSAATAPSRLGATPQAVARPQPSTASAPIADASPTDLRHDPDEAVAGSADQGSGLKAAFLAEIQRTRRFLYGAVVAQAQRIEFDPDRVTFTFATAHRALRAQLEHHRAWLEEIAQQIAGRKVAVIVQEGRPEIPASGATTGGASDTKPDLRARAMGDASVQAMLDVFPADIRDIEELGD